MEGSSANNNQQSYQTQFVLFAFLSANSDSFNSLFKVLFIFPSRYLFAIGLNLIFTFTWNLPPTLHSNPKERESKIAHSTQGTADGKQEFHPHCCSFSRGTHLDLHWQGISILHVKAKGPNFQNEQIHVRSQLLKKFHLVCFPPPTYMLKFSRFTG